MAGQPRENALSEHGESKGPRILHNGTRPRNHLNTENRTMNMIDALLGSQADGVVRQIGQQFGLDESQATSAITALLPALAAGLQHNASSQSGLDALLGALGGGQHQQYVDDIQSLGRPETIDDGNGILGHIFGSKDVSRQVARQASVQSGVGADVLKQMLPILASVLMGALAKGQFGGAGAQAGYRQGQGAQLGGGSILDMLGPLLGGGGAGTGGASIVTDVIGMLGKMMGGR